MAQIDHNRQVTSRLARRIYFSCGNRYFQKQVSLEKNREYFGSVFTENGLGHNFCLEAFFEGPIDPVTGMIVNLDLVDQWLKDVTDPLDHHFLNDDIEFFQNHVPTTENVARYGFEGISGKIQAAGIAVHLFKLRVFESDDLWVDYSSASRGSATSRERQSESDPTVHVTKRYKLSAVHRHHNPELSAEENRKLYHKCSHTHGHEYLISVTVRGAVDESSGLVVSRDLMDKIVGEGILEPFTGSYLNDHVGNTSGEIIAARFFDILEPEFLRDGMPDLARVSVQETRKNSFSQAAEGERKRA